MSNLVPKYLNDIADSCHADQGFVLTITRLQLHADLQISLDKISFPFYYILIFNNNFF